MDAHKNVKFVNRSRLRTNKWYTKHGTTPGKRHITYSVFAEIPSGNTDEIAKSMERAERQYKTVTLRHVMNGETAITQILCRNRR